MLPPLPPSPPLGPPRGTYFSRRNATQPLPPSPAFIEIFASSTNIKCLCVMRQRYGYRRPSSSLGTRRQPQDDNSTLIGVASNKKRPLPGQRPRKRLKPC